MKNIYELFSHLERDNVDSVLAKHGVTVPLGFTFSDINIVIGVNGSGKTRFLNAVRELCQANNDKVIYGYFPKLSDKRVVVPITDETLPEATLYEAAMYDMYDFEDFLEQIQNQNEAFLEGLLNYQSKAQKIWNDKIIASFSETFERLTGYKIVVKDKHVMLRKGRRIQSLYKIIHQFSPGQLMIFYLAIFISLQKSDSQKVIILDEPESHLHPAALLEFVTLLRQMNCFSQLFIATHSLFLIPEFEFENIVYLDSSSVVRRNSQIYIKMLSDMVGEDHEKKLQFFADVNQWQYASFLAECFLHPDVVDEANAHDEQVQLFIDFLKKKQSLAVLDFGAGSARLGRSLREADQDCFQRIRYDVFDVNPPENTYGFRYYTDLKKLSVGSYDCVVMMNVLHEIDPAEWTDIFHDLYSCMAEHSYLLFVEASVLSKGEQPNNVGYLVLGSREMKKLFQSSSDFPDIVLSKKQKSTCLIIEHQYLQNITGQTVRDAIRELEKNAYADLLKERNTGNAGRKYAFLTQLYLNAKIFNDSNQTKTITGSITADDSHKAIYLPISTKAELLEKVSSYLKSTHYRKAREAYMVSLLKQLCNAMESSLPISQKMMNDIWEWALDLERTHSDKTLIAVSLMLLMLADYQKAAPKILENGYILSLPNSIKEAIIQL